MKTIKNLREEKPSNALMLGHLAGSLFLITSAVLELNVRKAVIFSCQRCFLKQSNG